jgi:hypothetical protein
MHMQVKYTLPRPRTDVEHRTVTIFYSPLAGKPCSDNMAIADIRGVLRSGFLQTSNVPLRNNKNVRWSLWVNVFKGVRAFVFVDLLRRSCSFNHAAKQAPRIVVGHERA